MAAAVEMSPIDIKTMLLRRESGLLPHHFRQLCHAAPTLLPQSTALSAPLPACGVGAIGWGNETPCARSVPPSNRGGVCQSDNPDDNSPQIFVGVTIQRGQFPCSCRPTDNSAAANSPHKWRRTANSRSNFPYSRRPTANFGHQNGGFARKTLPQMPPPQINEGAAPQTAAHEIGSLSIRNSEWGGLGRGNTATIRPPNREHHDCRSLSINA